MPSVEELLSVAEADADKRSTIDSRIEIDADTRIIQMMPQDELFGVESDEKSERKYFKVHKIVGNGVDLSKLQLRINYQNASKIPSGKDMYIVTDATVYNDEWVYFSWELSRKVTQYKGNIYFIVCAIKADSNGNITNEWNTTLAEGKVLEGLEVETNQEQQYQASDYLEQLKQQLLDYSKEIKDTFPSDYTQIQDDIGSLKGDLSQLYSEIVEISDRVKEVRKDWNLLTKNAIRSLNKRRLKKYNMPSAFKLPISVYADGSGGYNYRIDRNILKIDGGTTRYVSPNGTKGNNRGTDASNPTTINNLLTNRYIEEGDTIIFEDGIHPFNSFTGGKKILKSCNLIARNDGKVVCVQKSEQELIWANHSGSIYKTSRPLVSNVLQIIGKRDYIPLRKVSAIGDMTEGSYAQIGDELYVWLLYGVVPTDDNLLVPLKYSTSMICVGGTNISPESTDIHTTPINLHLKGIDFIGGFPSTLFFVGDTTGKSFVHAENCKFIGAKDNTKSYDAISVIGGNAIFEKCEASYSSKDGFNYHKSEAGVIPQFAEFYCVAHDNGVDEYASESYTTMNGSTAHDGIVGLRYGGVYYANYGVAVADVHQGTETVNIQCTAFDSASPVQTRMYNCDFCAQQSGTTMHLLSCKSFGSVRSFFTVSNSTIYYHNCDVEHENDGSGSFLEEVFN